MTTRQYHAGIQLKVGDWVNCASMMMFGIAGRPSRIVSVRPRSVEIETATTGLEPGEVEFEKPRTKLKTSIEFVSDTYEEALAVDAACRDFLTTENRIAERQRVEHETRKRHTIRSISGGYRPGDTARVGDRIRVNDAGAGNAITYDDYVNGDTAVVNQVRDDGSVYVDWETNLGGTTDTQRIGLLFAREFEVIA